MKTKNLLITGLLTLLTPHITYAQFSNAASSAASSAQDGGEAGITELVGFVARNLDNWIAGGIIVVITWIIAKLIASALKKRIVNQREDVHESVLILVERITTFVVLAVGITIAAAINGLNFTAVIGALSLGIGFALKDIIGNFVSGIIMLSQHRIQIGDLIKVNDIIGTIVSIDTRATVLQAIDGTEVVIPNQSMLNETLISYSTNPFRRIELVVGVEYDTDLPMVTSLIRGIIEKDKNIVPNPEPLVLVDEFADSSININIKFWIESSKNWMNIRSNLANKIKKSFDEVGVNIPFPIRTLKLNEDDRSFLKTMDSLKKGIVPEETLVPDREKIIEAASKTESMEEIPHKYFNDKKRTTKDIVQEQKQVMQKSAEVEKKVAERTETPNVNTEEKPKAPPTHL